jgi:hypothetical protein
LRNHLYLKTFNAVLRKIREGEVESCLRSDAGAFKTEVVQVQVFLNFLNSCPPLPPKGTQGEIALIEYKFPLLPTHSFPTTPLQQFASKPV